MHSWLSWVFVLLVCMHSPNKLYPKLTGRYRNVPPGTQIKMWEPASEGVQRSADSTLTPFCRALCALHCAGSSTVVLKDFPPFSQVGARSHRVATTTKILRMNQSSQKIKSSICYFLRNSNHTVTWCSSLWENCSLPLSSAAQTNHIQKYSLGNRQPIAPVLSLQEYLLLCWAVWKWNRRSLEV